MGEVSADGSQLITDPDNFKFAIGVSLFRIESPSFPIIKGSLNIKALRGAVLETSEGGKFTSNLSSCVSPVQVLDPGVYILIISTFNP